MGDLARTIQGAMVISVNDIPEMREAFAGLHMKTLGITYTVGGAGGNESLELLIWNDNAERGHKPPAAMSLF